ncbi:MAG: aldo/keto reductase [Candidatus Parcubacteria bacterium]|nr:aldo/keto reductase [Burkholderiales bacterium]
MSRRRIVLQARTSSARLPGKVLLPLCGMPVVVLAALRASRGGGDIVVATSSDRSDDHLARIAESHGLRCMRGPLNDVLARFVAATTDLDDADLCIRLTSDNVFPDSDFVARLAQAAVQSAHGYAGFTGGSDGLPHGMAGEAMRVGLLRQADHEARQATDREHVTPWIIRHCGRNAPAFPRDPERDFSHLRCTIDTLDDYRLVRAALASLSDPVAAPSLELCRRLARWVETGAALVPARIVSGELQSTLVLGGAQFGSRYGIANATGMPKDAELGRILAAAEKAGVTHLDTAAAYGESEARVGAALSHDSPLSIVTKLPPDLLQEYRLGVLAAVASASSRLRRARLDVVLLHRFEHFSASGGIAWRELMELKREGRIGRIGCSIYRPDELLALLAETSVDFVQLPFNLLDRRWLESGIQLALAARPDIVVHGRSALLQGLLTITDPSRWPGDDRSLATRCIETLRELAASMGRVSVADLCFAYARSQPWLAGVVAGVETAAQMSDNIEIFRRPVLTPAELATVSAALPPELPEELLNPALWPGAV